MISSRVVIEGWDEVGPTCSEMPRIRKLLLVNCDGVDLISHFGEEGTKEHFIFKILLNLGFTGKLEKIRRVFL